MKAIVYGEYGPPEVLKMAEVARPSPKDDEVLVAVEAASVNSRDWRYLTSDPFLVRFMGGGLLKPKHPILGADIAGRVVTVGKDVKQFQPGDEVFGDISSCGCGGFAEYVSARETAFVRKPTNLTFEESAAVPLAAVAALQGLRDKGQIKPGQQVLINGASGGVGTYMVQIAKSFGAEVTAVCSTKNLDMARSLGADHVIDYTQEDFSTSGKHYDLILAPSGNRSLAEYRRALKPSGVYVMVGGSTSQIFQALLKGPLVSMTGKQKVRILSSGPDQTDLGTVKQLLETGQVRPVIDSSYRLEEIPDALRYFGQGHTHGKIVIKVADPDAA
jgi:NADPH:quinone reductase-like Zn-dependent oxidoreductase